MNKCEQDKNKTITAVDRESFWRSAAGPAVRLAGLAG